MGTDPAFLKRGSHRLGGTMSQMQQSRLRGEAVSAAEALFLKEHFSLENLAHELNCSLAEVTRSVGSVDSLVVEVNSRTLDRLLASVSNDAVSAESPQETVQSLCRVFLSFCQQHRPMVALLFHHPFEEHFERPQWYLDQVAACFRPMENALQKLAPACGPESCAMAARAVWSQVFGVFYLLYNHRLDALGIESQGSLVRFSIDTFLRGWA
jgi:AcrR family transcriptional regulator